MLSNEASVNDKFLVTIQKRDSRYEVSLPWKKHHPFLPENYKVKVSRLNSEASDEKTGIIRRVQQNN